MFPLIEITHPRHYKNSYNLSLLLIHRKNGPLKLVQTKIGLKEKAGTPCVSSNPLLRGWKGARRHRLVDSSLKYQVNNDAVGVEEERKVITPCVCGKGTSWLTTSSIIIEGLWRDSNRWMSSTVTSAQPAPSRLPISSLSFIGFRYLFSFQEFEPKLGWFTISRSMEIGRTSVGEQRFL